MALIKDAYGKERDPASSSAKNTASGSTPAPSSASVNEQQRAEQVAMRNLQKPASSSFSGNSQTSSNNSFGSSSQTSSGSPFRSGPASGNAWKSTPTSSSQINQELRAEPFSARRMGTTLQGGSGSYLGLQGQKQKQATDTKPTRQTKPVDETKPTTQKQPEYQPWLFVIL